MARLLVETLLQMRAAGFTLRDIAIALSLARLSSGGSLVEPLEQDILLSWCAMAMLTLDSLGVHLPAEAVRGPHPCLHASTAHAAVCGLIS